MDHIGNHKQTHTQTRINKQSKVTKQHKGIILNNLDAKQPSPTLWPLLTVSTNTHII